MVYGNFATSVKSHSLSFPCYKSQLQSPFPKCTLSIPIPSGIPRTVVNVEIQKWRNCTFNFGPNSLFVAGPIALWKLKNTFRWMNDMHNSAYQISINFLHSNLICSCKRSLYCSLRLRSEVGNAMSYKLKVGNGVPVRPIAVDHCPRGNGNPDTNSRCRPIQDAPFELTWYPGRHEQLSVNMIGSARHW